MPLVLEKLLEQGVGRDLSGNGFGGEDGWQAFLSVVVEALDFLPGLWRGSVAQGAFAEAQGCACRPLNSYLSAIQLCSGSLLNLYEDNVHAIRVASGVKMFPEKRLAVPE